MTTAKANADYENANQALRTKLSKVEQENSTLKAEVEQLKEALHPTLDMGDPAGGPSEGQ